MTCKSGRTTKDFKGAHCSSTDKVPLGTGTFSHFKVEKGTPTTFSGTNAGTKNETKEATPATLASIFGGVDLDIEWSTVSSTGSIENTEPAVETHKIVGFSIVIIFSGCVVTKPAGQECKVAGGKVTTNSLKSESVEDTEKFTPTSGTTFATLTVEGCKTVALNGSKALTGSVSASPNGATRIVDIPRNAESTLEFGGQKAGLSLTMTTRGKKTAGSETTEPLSTTTTPLVLGG